MNAIANPLTARGATPAATVCELDRQLRRSRRYVVLGFLTIIAVFAGFGGWAATAELSGAALASGNVVVASNIKKIQHPTGGVVGKIMVKNGDHVKSGDLLLRLDDTITRANLGIINAQVDQLTGQRARLIAERDDRPEIDFPAQLRDRDPSTTAAAMIIEGEKSLFEKRLETRTSQKAQLQKRIDAMAQQAGGFRAQIAAKSVEVELLGRQLESLSDLEDKQLVTTAKMMELRRDAARLQGERGQLEASVGEASGKIAEIEVQKLGLDAEAKSSVAKELREAESKLAELGERRVAAEDQLKRIDMRSPVDGIVHQMSVFTVGGVVSTTEPVMLIVPDSEKLVIEAKLSPNDIDQVHVASQAIVRFPAFNQRVTPAVQGVVTTIAADVTKDAQTNVMYFSARIEIPEDELAKLEGLKLAPGMPAELQIRTAQRTALSYLTKPFTDQYARAFKER